MKPKFGQWILFRAKFSERFTDTDGKRKRLTINLHKPREGIFLGYRTISEGFVQTWTEDTPFIKVQMSEYVPTCHIHAALVCPGPQENPIYVPADLIRPLPQQQELFT